MSIHAYIHIQKYDASDLTVDFLGHVQNNQNTNEGEQHEITTGKVQNLRFMAIDASKSDIYGACGDNANHWPAKVTLSRND